MIAELIVATKSKLDSVYFELCLCLEVDFEELLLSEIIISYERYFDPQQSMILGLNQLLTHPI